MISMGACSPDPTVKVHGNYLITRMIRNIDIFRFDINHRFQAGYSLRYLTLCCIGHLLSNNLQSVWRDAENKPATI